MLVFLLFLTLNEVVSLEEGMSGEWFSVVTGDHTLLIDSLHTDIHSIKVFFVLRGEPSPIREKRKRWFPLGREEEALAFGNAILFASSELSNISPLLNRIRKEHTLNYIIYEFGIKKREEGEGSNSRILHALHGHYRASQSSFSKDQRPLDPRVLFFERNAQVQYKPHYTRTNVSPTPLSAVPTIRFKPSRPRTVEAQQILCRYSQSSGRSGYQPGSFSWGVDVIDSRAPGMDLAFCPAANARGDGVDVFILDTGLGYDITMNNSMVYRDFDYYYNPDTYGSREPTSDGDGHGSHTGGLIASTVYGVAPGVRLHVYKVLNDQGFGSFSALAAALTDIYSRGTRRGVISMSLGTIQDSSLAVETLLLNLISDRDMVVVAAAGNDAQDACQNFPSNVNGVISVGATDINYWKASFSNFGRCVTLFSPGKDIMSCGKSLNSPLIMSGTSMATPIVAGTMALLVQLFPSLSSKQLTSKLVDISTKNTLLNLGSSSPNRFVYIGGVSSGGGGGGVDSPSTPPSPNDSTTKSVYIATLFFLMVMYIL